MKRLITVVLSAMMILQPLGCIFSYATEGAGINSLGEAIDVCTSDELETAIDNDEALIHITSDITLDRSFYIRG